MPDHVPAIHIITHRRYPPFDSRTSSGYQYIIWSVRAEDLAAYCVNVRPEGVKPRPLAGVCRLSMDREAPSDLQGGTNCIYARLRRPGIGASEGASARDALDGPFWK